MVVNVHLLETRYGLDALSSNHGLFARTIWNYLLWTAGAFLKGSVVLWSTLNKTRT